MASSNTSNNTITDTLADSRITSVSLSISKMPQQPPDTPSDALTTSIFTPQRKRVRFADEVGPVPASRHITWAADVPPLQPRTAHVTLVAKHETLSPSAYNWVFASGAGIDIAGRQQRWRLLYFGGREKLCPSANTAGRAANVVRIEGACGGGGGQGPELRAAAAAATSWAPARTAGLLLAELHAYHAYRTNPPRTASCLRPPQHSSQTGDHYHDDDDAATQHVRFARDIPEQDLAVRTTRPTCYRVPSASAPSTAPPAAARSRRATICEGVKRASRFLFDYSERRAEAQARRTAFCRAAVWESFAPSELRMKRRMAGEYVH